MFLLRMHMQCLINISIYSSLECLILIGSTVRYFLSFVNHGKATS